jgi:translation elongation factor EF-G
MEPRSPDHTAEEIERGFSINLGCAFAEWMDTKINLIDTPGYLDSRVTRSPARGC